MKERFDENEEHRVKFPSETLNRNQNSFLLLT